IEENVIYFGRKKQNELPLYYNSIDLFIASSMLMESLGLIGLEAMSCAIPVAGSNRGGIATYVDDGLNGYLFEAGSANDLVLVIKKYYFLSDDHRQVLSEQAIKTASKYELEYVNDKLGKKLQNLT
ncbi:glycosyltransferase, partial [Sulfuricurvum sp.]|uniref:glycosyltransferase n=1 Tax=Sulfuricurvum sp. TaxID=2025608 RepID=UPI003C4FF5A3